MGSGGGFFGGGNFLGQQFGFAGAGVAQGVRAGAEQEVANLRTRVSMTESIDARDQANPHGGFYQAADAHLLDTTLLDIEAALRAAVAIVDAAVAGKAGQTP